MQSKSDAQLLCEYATQGVEAAFSELVFRHTNLVYSAALRQLECPDEGDFNSVLASLTPSFVVKARKAWGDKIESELKAEWHVDLDRVSRCHISKKEVVSDSEVNLFFSLSAPAQPFGDEGETRVSSMGFGMKAKRLNNEWRLEPE